MILLKFKLEVFHIHKEEHLLETLNQLSNLKARIIKRTMTKHDLLIDIIDDKDFDNDNILLLGVLIGQTLAP